MRGGLRQALVDLERFFGFALPERDRGKELGSRALEEHRRSL